MKKKYNAPLAEILELEIDETVCTDIGTVSGGTGTGAGTDDEGDVGGIL